MRIFVAGASGVVGRRMIALLTGQGHDVTGLTRRPGATEALEKAGCDAVVADVYDAKALAAVVGAARPDVVIHQLTDLSAGDRVANARVRDIGTRNLVEAALEASVSRIVVQSIAWAYETGEGPADEATPLDHDGDAERSQTVRSIAALENTARRLPEWVVLRYGTFYGPGTWYCPSGLMADLARAGRLPAGPDVTSFVHVEDAAAAALSALTWPSGIVNVCDDAPATGREWAPAFCAAVEAPAPVLTDTGAVWARGADNHYLRTQLNWVPRWTTWREGFASFSGPVGHHPV